MSIEYEVRDVIYVVLKHWYVLLGCILICGVLSLPLSKYSYQKSVDNYQELVKNAKSVAEQIEWETKIYIYGSEDRQMKKALAQDILMLAENLGEDLKYLEFESVYYESINVLVLRGGDIQKEEYTNFIQILKDNINQILLANIDLPIEIDVKEVIEDKVSDEADLLMKEPEQKETNIKVIGTASIFGCLLGLVIVMILDYIKCWKKIYIESRKQSVELK